MGNQPSTPLQTCLNAVCDGRSSCVAYPDAPLYQAAWVKPYNLEVPVSPIAVIRPNTADEVAKSIKCAIDAGIKVQAKSGGHSYANFGLGGDGGGLMIDLKNLNSFKMNTDNWQATFGAGFRLGELDKQLHANGKRAMPHGTCPGVGIGGHATIGGLGPSGRMWGGALDQVVEVEVVTADGKIQRANEKQNSDLFWALRGAGASYGVITEFVVKTHPEPGNVVQYSYGFSFGKQRDMAPVYRKWQKMVADPNMDRRFSTLFIAEPLGAVITGTFYGTKEEYEASGIPAQLPGGGKLNLTISDWLGGLAHEAERAGLYLGDLSTHFISRSLAFREQDMLDDKAIDNLFNYMDEANKGTIAWAIIWNSEGGAMNDVPMDATAYPHRDKLMMYQSYLISLGEAPQEVHDYADGIHQHVVAGAPNAKTTYAGYIDITLNRTQANQFYWGDKVPKLRDIKKKWDAKDLFRNPQSLEPAE